MAGWLSWLEHCPVQQKVAGLIPGRGTYRRSLIKFLFHINVPLPLSLSPSLKLILKTYPWVRIKEKKFFNLNNQNQEKLTSKGREGQGKEKLSTSLKL